MKGCGKYMGGAYCEFCTCCQKEHLCESCQKKETSECEYCHSQIIGNARYCDPMCYKLHRQETDSAVGLTAPIDSTCKSGGSESRPDTHTRQDKVQQTPTKRFNTELGKQVSSSAPAENILARINDDDLVEQIYKNMVLRGILPEAENADEYGIDISELKVLAYNIRKRVKLEMLDAVELMANEEYESDCGCHFEDQFCKCKIAGFLDRLAKMREEIGKC